MQTKGQSLYEEVYHAILEDIRTGRYPENSALPDERSLARTYHVSRSTLRQALAILKQNELVFSIQGNGTFVRPHVFTQPLTRFYSFTDTLKNDNVLIRNEIVELETVRADETLACRTGNPEGSLFHRLVRLRSAETYPLMLETTFLPVSRFPQLDREILSAGSLYEYLRSEYCFHANRASETFCSVMPGPEEKQILRMPANTPCILLERFSFEEDSVIEYTRSVIRGDKYRFHVELAGRPNE